MKKENLKDLLIFPLINDMGWNTNCREWNNLDLNRCFGNINAPEFIKQICKTQPKYLIDLHEDSETDYPYVFQYINDTPSHIENLIYRFDLEMEIWKDDPMWIGSSEYFFRNNGLEFGITLEVPPIWSLEKRSIFQVMILDYCIKNIFNN